MGGRLWGSCNGTVGVQSLLCGVQSIGGCVVDRWCMQSIGSNVRVGVSSCGVVCYTGIRNKGGQ